MKTKFSILGALVFLLFCHSTRAANLKVLPGHVPQIIRRLTAQNVLPGTNQLNLAIGLPLRDPAGLDKFLAAVYDPASPDFRKFLTPEEFTARFGPTESDYEQIKNFARTNGLTVTGAYGNRLLLDVRGPAAAVEKAFHVTLRTYRHPTENRIFFAPDNEPMVDAKLPIADVSGLDNYSRPHSNLRRRQPAVSPRVGSGSGGAYLGGDFRAAYAPGTTLTGAGQMVGLVQFDGFYSNDIVAYANAAGQNVVPLQTVLIDGFNGQPTTGGSSGNEEVSLDIEMAMAMAPGLSKIVVFEGNPNNFIPNDVLNVMAASNTVKNLSSSWGWSGGPSTTTETIFKQMAAQGQSYFNASGDSDAFTANMDSSGNSTQPSSSPNITQVGGTTLTTASAGGAYSSEKVWNWGLQSGSYVGSSGGVSSYYAIPSWQLGIQSFAANGGSTTMRNIPDVAMVGDNVLIYYGNGSNETVGGTSCAAPLWAGFMALVNQQAAAAGESSIGFLNPAVYELADESIYNSVFHDVTTGDNTWSSSPNAYYAVANYDLCTGVGTPNGTNLINALVHPDSLIVVSNYGFNVTNNGSSSVTQTFFLTNSSSASLTWSLVNTSAWLQASSDGDTLSPGANESVVISLNSSAADLNPGVHTAMLWFSNVTSGVGHARLFTLTRVDALAILQTNNLNFAGAVGGPFAPAAQQIILTNLSAADLSWGLGNTSAWFNVSAAAGNLSAGAQAVVNITLTDSVTNLPAGDYTAFFTVTNENSQVVQTFSESLAIGESLVQNGGFETGDFTDWTLTGGAGNTNFVDDGSYTGVSPHSGNYFAALGEPGKLAYLAQTMPTVAGQKYLLSLWLDNPTAGGRGNRNQFTVYWNSNALDNLSNFPEFTWSNLQFVVTATNDASGLQFGAREDNSYVCLDDVSLIPVFAPTVSISPTNAIILSGGNVTFTAAVSGAPTPVVQWSKNTAAISDATNNTFSLTAVTTNDNGSYTLVATNLLGAATNSVTLTVYPPPVLSVAASGLANSSLTLNFSGAPGYTYILQTTTNLSASGSWQNVATNTFDASGLWQYTDAQVTNSPQQFYRLKLAQ